MAVLTWKRSEIRDRWRELTGRTQVADISNDDVDALLNDYYVNYFPEDALVTNFDGFFTQAAIATDNGEYSLAQSIVKLMEPMTINGAEITFHQDKNYFFQMYPDDEQYITAPSIAIGALDTTKVLNAAFTFDHQGQSYSKASQENTFVGLSTIPQNKYGAFCLKIESDGTVTIYEADDNATGYDSPGLAIAALPDADSDTAYMGYVTVINTAVAGFIPGTTDQAAGTVTATYTDGDPANRGTPSGALFIHNKLFLRPKADDTYQFQAASEMNRPSALAADTDVPGDPKWGPAIALGAAIIYLAPRGGSKRIEELTGIPNFSLAEYRLSSIKTKKRLSMRGRVAEPSF